METVGPKLRDARVARGLSLEDVAAITKVPKSTLALIEVDQYATLPAPVFVRGFIRSYAKVVGLDPNPLVRSFERGSGDGGASVERERPMVGVPEIRAQAGQPAGRESSLARAQREKKDARLVPLQPVSERREGASLRGGYALLAAVAIGLLVAAFLLVGGKRPATDASARGPTAPALHDPINGIGPELAPGGAAGSRPPAAGGFGTPR